MLLFHIIGFIVKTSLESRFFLTPWLLVFFKYHPHLLFKKMPPSRVSGTNLLFYKCWPQRYNLILIISTDCCIDVNLYSLSARTILPQTYQSKYGELLNVIEDLGREIKPTYAGSKMAQERLKKGSFLFYDFMSIQHLILFRTVDYECSSTTTKIVSGMKILSLPKAMV